MLQLATPIPLNPLYSIFAAELTSIFKTGFVGAFVGSAAFVGSSLFSAASVTVLLPRLSSSSSSSSDSHPTNTRAAINNSHTIPSKRFFIRFSFRRHGTYFYEVSLYRDVCQDIPIPTMLSIVAVLQKCRNIKQYQAIRTQRKKADRFPVQPLAFLHIQNYASCGMISFLL